MVDVVAVPDNGLEALALADDELSRAGQHAEVLVAEAGRALRPGGLLLATAWNPLFPRSDASTRGFSSAQLVAALAHRGFTVELVCAPTALSRANGAQRRYDREHDRLPGLLDAAPRVVAVARSPASPAARSGTFFATIPRKVVASAVLCRDADGQVLVVHDAFQGHWTVPGGVVDADEDPVSAAAREAWEEGGVRVAVGDLLGVFAASWPDRLVFVYAAEPETEPSPPQPVHRHEIDDAAWLPLDQALARVNPRTRWQLERCLDSPGRTWRQ